MESTSTLANQMQSLSLEPNISYKELRASFNDAFVSLADFNFINNGDNFGDGIFYYQWLKEEPFEVIVRSLHIQGRRGCYFHLGKFSCPVHKCPEVYTTIMGPHEDHYVPEKERTIITEEGNLIYIYFTPSKPLGKSLNLSHKGIGEFIISVGMKCKDCKLDPVVGTEEHSEFTDD